MISLFPLCYPGEKQGSERLVFQLTQLFRDRAEYEVQLSCLSVQGSLQHPGQVFSSGHHTPFSSPPLVHTNHPWYSNSILSGRFWGFASLKCK